MARNRSERGPHVVKQITWKPRTWDGYTHVYLVHRPDSRWPYQVWYRGSRYYESDVYMRKFASLVDAQACLNIMASGPTSFSDLPGSSYSMRAHLLIGQLDMDFGYVP